MDFKSDAFMYALGFGVALFVIAQACFFLARAWKRGKEIGMSASSMKNAVISSSLFSIAPAFSIVATVLTLSAALGLVIPWIRLTVIGNISYEASAAQSAIEAYGIAGGLSQEVTDPKVFVTIVWVMTAGSILPLVLIPFLLKRMQKSMGKVMDRDTKWADAMSAAAFIGLIAAFIARSIAGQGDPDIVGDGAGVLSVLTLISAIGLMFLFQFLNKRFQWQWLNSFAMPLSMIGAMGVAVLAAQILPYDIAYLEWRG
ncbi:MAG: DUF5058 family protein [Clostridiales bacterium]|nr:DUF5058 family protein [Clostridiales bacterium]